MTVRLLANENFPRPAALAYAAANALWLVTFDRDYGELVFARRAPAPPAILYLRQGAYPPTWPAEAVLAALDRAEFVAGHLVVIAGQSVRRRALPAAPGA